MGKYYKILLILILLTCGCKPTTSYLIKDFFFDGVPNPQENLLTEKIDTINSIIIDSVQISLNDSGPKWVGSLHPPNTKRECYECHSENQRAKKMLPLDGLCFKCHENPINIYSNAHGPVESENCTVDATISSQFKVLQESLRKKG